MRWFHFALIAIFLFYTQASLAYSDVEVDAKVDNNKRKIEKNRNNSNTQKRSI